MRVADVGHLSEIDRGLLDAAIIEAKQSASEGGIPIGAALGTVEGQILSTGHNLRVQTGDSTAHAEIVCLREAGRRRDWESLILATTLSPCVMCCGAILLHRIPRIIIGDSDTFLGEETLLELRGVSLTQAGDLQCRKMMAGFIERSPAIWNEDIGAPGG